MSWSGTRASPPRPDRARARRLVRPPHVGVRRDDAAPLPFQDRQRRTAVRRRHRHADDARAAARVASRRGCSSHCRVHRSSRSRCSRPARERLPNSRSPSRSRSSAPAGHAARRRARAAMAPGADAACAHLHRAADRAAVRGARQPGHCAGCRPRARRRRGIHRAQRESRRHRRARRAHRREAR